MTSVPLYTRSIKTGRGVLFVDLKVAKNGRKYLQLSAVLNETDESGKRRRISIQIFGNAVEELRKAIAAMPEAFDHEGEMSNEN
jgi:hypothetical protein